ncbi:MAG: hypothetical protein M1834_008527 [Cirrosporium novae-zelandiae]|nr:MAG: hypothetical protein M1834_008527 [Cirrosporium novae-zelandiae]
MARPPRESPARHKAKRKSTNPNGDTRASPARHGHRNGERSAHRKTRHVITDSADSGTGLLSHDALTRLNIQNTLRAEEEREEARRREKENRRRKEKEARRRREKRAAAAVAAARDKHEGNVVIGREAKERRKGKSKRVVSGAILEEGRGGPRARRRGGFEESDLSKQEKEPNPNKKKWIIIGAVVAVVLLVIIIAVAVSVSKKSSSSSSSSDSSSEPTDASSATISNNCTGANVPVSAKDTYWDPCSWYDTTDFNVTYTNDTVGGLPIIGLNSTWDDTAQANDNVPALNKDWDYGTMPIRGVNLGGWLSIEPWITPSLFDTYSLDLGIIDEWTLCEHLGSTEAASTLEQHYATFVTEQTFADIQDSGLDHVRVQYSYWAVETYDGDPYVERISWRYLLRGLEWARKYGLRIDLDLHALPGSQNGWSHSGHQGVVGWLNGTDGTLNAQRSLEIHNKLTTFFAQDRYKNLVTLYGVANEPKMMRLDVSKVLNWTENVVTTARSNGLDSYIVFGDGFLGLDNWQGRFEGINKLILDVHQYLIFNVAQIVYTHEKKVSYACSGWTEQTLASINTTTGFGPTICGEWSQADTDCSLYLNNVGNGNRWTGNFTDQTHDSQDVSSPICPLKDSTCECTTALSDPSQYSDEYKKFLLYFAEAQMYSFEQGGWGWFYWTWETESAPQWSWKAGRAAGILPSKAYSRSWDCTDDVPDFSSLSEKY